MSKYLPKPKALGANATVDLDLSYYATKADLKNATRFETCEFAKQVDLTNLNSDANKSDIDKLNKNQVVKAI